MSEREEQLEDQLEDHEYYVKRAQQLWADNEKLWAKVDELETAMEEVADELIDHAAIILSEGGENPFARQLEVLADTLSSISGGA